MLGVLPWFCTHLHIWDKNHDTDDIPPLVFEIFASLFLWFAKPVDTERAFNCRESMRVF